MCYIPEIHLAGFVLRQAHKDDRTLGNNRCYDKCGQDDDEDGAKCETEVTWMPSHISKGVFNEEFEFLPAPLLDIILVTFEIGRHGISIRGFAHLNLRLVLVGAK